MASAHVHGFLPTQHGFRFPNFFAPQPLFCFPLPPFRGIPIGDAKNGLCGGMIFAARDCFESGFPLPEINESPRYGSPLFAYLVRRLFDSFDLPFGPVKYYRWMANRDDQTLMQRTLIDEWPRVCADLEAGLLVPLALVRVQSRDPRRMGENHQVLAYAYGQDEASGSLLIGVYDPNHPGRNDVTLALNVRDRSAIIASTGERVRGFFRTPYRFRSVPTLLRAENHERTGITVGVSHASISSEHRDPGAIVESGPEHG
jgi:hypothetical protein